MRNLDCYFGHHAFVVTRRAKAPRLLRIIFALDEWWPYWELRQQCWNCDLDQPHAPKIPPRLLEP